MASKRMISSDIWRDDFIGALDWFFQVLWIGLIVTCADDQGRMYDNALIRNDVFPMRDDVTWSDISAALDRFQAAGKILRYETANGKRAIQIVKWWSYQQPRFALPSSIPAPAGWTDRVNYNGKENKRISENWDQPGGFSRLGANESVNPGVNPGVNMGVSPGVSPDVYADATPEPAAPVAKVSKPTIKPRKAPAVSPAQLAELTTLYEQNIGAITPMTGDMLSDDLAGYGFDWCKDAMLQAVRHEARNWAYAQSILKRWKKEGKEDKSIQRGRAQKAQAPAAPTLADALRKEFANGI